MCLIKPYLQLRGACERPLGVVGELVAHQVGYVQDSLPVKAVSSSQLTIVEVVEPQSLTVDGALANFNVIIIIYIHEFRHFCFPKLWRLKNWAALPVATVFELAPDSLELWQVWLLRAGAKSWRQLDFYWRHVETSANSAVAIIVTTAPGLNGLSAASNVTKTDRF